MTVSVRVGNAGDRDGAEVVQLYLHDPVASVVRPVQRLIGFARVAARRAARAARRELRGVPPTSRRFTGRDGRRIVEPGEIVLGLRPLERRHRAGGLGAPDRRGPRGRPHPCAPRGGGASTRCDVKAPARVSRRLRCVGASGVARRAAAHHEVRGEVHPQRVDARRRRRGAAPGASPPRPSAAAAGGRS